eukprot:Sspe_Gene.61040::Locus_33764_Transcript_1_3_Confidence_0.200_Length_1000::g.61040::m.61040
MQSEPEGSAWSRLCTHPSADDAAQTDVPQKAIPVGHHLLPSPHVPFFDAVRAGLGVDSEVPPSELIRRLAARRGLEREDADSLPRKRSKRLRQLHDGLSQVMAGLEELRGHCPDHLLRPLIAAQTEQIELVESLQQQPHAAMSPCQSALHYSTRP